jgi:hypothetical protein
VHFAETSRVSHHAALVLETMIERMEEIVPFLDNVESIETQSRRTLKDGRIKIVRRWQGRADTMPTALRPFLTRDFMGWIDTAVWTPAQHAVEWSQSMCSQGVAALYTCSGVNSFEPHPDDPQHATLIRVSGDLVLHADRLPGIPRFLASRLAPQVEQFIVGLVTPNLKGLAKGLQRYFDQRARRG